LAILTLILYKFAALCALIGAPASLFSAFAIVFDSFSNKTSHAACLFDVQLTLAT
jgi:hypothetical protein